jgi:hypothetical protein
MAEVVYDLIWPLICGLRVAAAVAVPAAAVGKGEGGIVSPNPSF